MSRNYVFVQRGIRAVKLRQMTVGVCLCIDTCVMLIGDVRSLSDSSKKEGVSSGIKVICGKLRYYICSEFF